MWNCFKLNAMDTNSSNNIDGWKILQSATINGARALHIDSKTGSLENGKYADIVLLSTDELGLSPMRSETTIPLIINSGNTRNVKYVLSRGVAVVENGELSNYKESELSNNLTHNAKAIDEKVKKGKIWQNNYIITNDSINSYWYKYRSVRKPDSLNVVISNSTSNTLTLNILSSGTTFGGGTELVVDQSVSQRFPQQVSNKAFKEQFSIPKNGSIQITKVKNKLTYEILIGSKKIIKDYSPGQLLLLVTN
jgi:hypothetical protein